MPPKRGEGAAKRLMGFAEEEVVNGRHTGRFWIHVPVEAAPGLIRDIAALEASSPSALIAAVEAQMKIAENHLAEAKNDAKEEGWDSETVEYAGRQEGKVLAFLAVLKLLRSPPTEAAER